MIQSMVIDEYEEKILDMYMKTHPNAPRDRATQLISQLTESKLLDIPCKLHNNITHETVETTTLATFDWIRQRNPIITGNGTFFKQHEEYAAPSTSMLEFLGGYRATLKDRMYSFDPSTVEYKNANTGQNNVKKIMNADYGGTAATTSPFYSVYIPPATTLTAKNITTSLICCLELLSGNTDPWAKLNGINELYDMIYIVLDEPIGDRVYIEDDTFTPTEVANWLISKVARYTIEDYEYLKAYLATLSPFELKKLMLCNNIRLVLTVYVADVVNRLMSYYKAHKIDIEHTTKESLYESGFGEKPPEELIGDLNLINKIVVDNCVYPFIPNDVEARANNMDNRLIVCVTDTDSLMVHFTHYRKEFQCDDDPVMRDSCLLASALGTRLFIEAIIPKFVSYVATGMQIKDKHYRDKFIFKNEFGFLAMSLLAKKMYAASMFVQEGKPRNVHKISATGLSFKKRDAASFLEPIMLELYDKYILTPTQINVAALYQAYVDIRYKIMKELRESTSYFKVASFNDPLAYDANRVLPDQIRGSLVWNTMVPDEEIMLADRIKVIPLSFDLIERNLDDLRVNEINRISLIDNENKKYNPVICIPEHYRTIPEWISKVIDVEFTVDKLLTPFKQLFSLFDMYLADTRGGVIASSMIYL